MARRVMVEVLKEKGSDWYVARCPYNFVASQGKNIDEALANFKEAIELYFCDSDREELDDKLPHDVDAFVTTITVDLHGE